MATLKGNLLKCKKHIKEVLRNIDEGKYKIDYTLTKVGIDVTDKRSYHDTFTISYIDEEAKGK